MTKAPSRNLGSVADFVMGQAPPGKECNKEGHGTPFVKAGEFEERFPAVREWTTRPLKLAKNGDVLVCVVGATAGKVNQGIDCAIGRSVAAVRPSRALATEYLYHFLATKVHALRSKSQGLAQGVITRDMLNELCIPTPPIDEQRHIAAVLDKAEELRTKRRAALAELDTLTQSIFLEMFGDPAQNTKKLPTVLLGELGTWSSGGTPPRSRNDYFNGTVPWFSSGELNDMFVFASEEHVSPLALHGTSAKAVPAGALMLGMYDTAALKTSIAGVSCSCNQAIAFASIDGALAETLYVYFAIVIGREHFRRLQRGVRQKNLNLSMVREISIPLPALPLQREFANRVTAIEALKAKHRTALAELDALFASLEHRAFRGEL